MKTRNILVALAVVFTLINASITFAASDSYRNVYSGFGIEDSDPDLDGVTSKDDKCPGSSFDIFVITKHTQKEKSTVPFTDAYLRLNKISKSGEKLTFQTSSSESFTEDVKDYTVEPRKITEITSIGKRVRVLYASASKGVAVVWVSELEGSTPGCTVEESLGTEDMGY